LSLIFSSVYNHDHNLCIKSDISKIGTDDQSYDSIILTSEDFLSHCSIDLWKCCNIAIEANLLAW